MAASPSTIDASHWLDQHVHAVTDVPRGRKGLWGALALRSAPDVVGLPVTDPLSLGRSTPNMFDVDPSRSIDLTVS